RCPLRGRSRLGTALRRSSFLRILADHDQRVGLIAVGRYDEVRRRRHALQHAAREIELRLMAGAEEAAEPVAAEVGRGDFGPVRRRTAEVRADADGDPELGLDRAVLVLAVLGLLRNL